MPKLDKNIVNLLFFKPPSSDFLKFREVFHQNDVVVFSNFLKKFQKPYFRHRMKYVSLLKM